MHPRHYFLQIALLAALTLAACNGIYQRKNSNANLPKLTGKPLIVVAAGDIACDPESSRYNQKKGTSDGCHMKSTSDMAMAQNPDAVLALGDNQYESGGLLAFKESYDPTWGRMKAKTYPVPGNHEYHVRGAKPYYEYFGDRAGDPAKGYYSFNLGPWHIIALNSNCGEVSCGTGSEQEKWLRADLAANHSACTLAYWHAPRFSSGLHGDSAAFSAFWRDLFDARADVVLNGHDHDYERFSPQTPNAASDEARGIREFVVGTGGKNLRGFARGVAWHRNHNGDTRQSVYFGILRMDLYPTGYSWKYLSEHPDKYSDEGVSLCHGANPALSAQPSGVSK